MYLTYVSRGEETDNTLLVSVKHRASSYHTSLPLTKNSSSDYLLFARSYHTSFGSYTNQIDQIQMVLYKKTVCGLDVAKHVGLGLWSHSGHR